MARWRCGGTDGCGTVYALRLFVCPRCHGTHFEEEDRMAKITRHGGPTNASAGPGEPGHMPPPEVVEPEAVLAPVLVGEPGPELADFPPEPEPEPEVPAVDEAPAADDTAPAPTSRRNRRTN